MAFVPSLISGLAISLCALILGFCLGIPLGRYLIARRFRHEYLEFSATETLGAMLNTEQRKTYSAAYKDPAAALAAMDQISYAVPNVLTPFVTCGPQPGQSGNAFVNSMQFRSRVEVAMPKPAHTYRIFITGGSTAFGSGTLSQETTIGAYLERKLNLSPSGNRTYEVFTLANPAWSSAHERIVIENRLSELAPNLVISFSGNNDAHWAVAERDTYWMRTYAEEHMWKLLNLARRLEGLGPMPDVVSVPARFTPEEMADRLVKNARLGAMALRLAGSEYIFALQPMIALSTKEFSPREKEIRAAEDIDGTKYFVSCYQQFRARLGSLTEEGIIYFDMSDLFAGFGAADEIFLDSYHFGDRGYEIIGLALADLVTPIIQKSV